LPKDTPTLLFMRPVLPWCGIDSSGCVYCKGREFAQQSVINDELAKTWGLSARERDSFDEREGHFCQTCHMSKRVRMLLWSLKRVQPDFENLQILHLNQANDLSQAMCRAERLVETTYQPDQEFGIAINGFSNQDMTRLTFEGYRFDVVVHSETLEHLHDYEVALGEASRVLKPGGYHLYT